MLPERIDRVRDLCAGWVKSGHTPAIVALVARRGVIKTVSLGQVGGSGQ